MTNPPDSQSTWSRIQQLSVQEHITNNTLQVIRTNLARELQQWIAEQHNQQQAVDWLRRQQFQNLSILLPEAVRGKDATADSNHRSYVMIEYKRDEQTRQQGRIYKARLRKGRMQGKLVASRQWVEILKLVEL